MAHDAWHGGATAQTQSGHNYARRGVSPVTRDIFGVFGTIAPRATPAPAPRATPAPAPFLLHPTGAIPVAPPYVFPVLPRNPY